jgi:two-component system nitrogen regulation response regulator NtrX
MLRQDVEETEELEGESPQTASLRQTIERLSKNNSRVLMEGSAGVGKETIARLIHKHSSRRGQPFLVINCSNLNPNSFEADFFGREVRSESGGLTISLGLLERADRGTLYLDNIQDMPLETQSKILQAIQEQKFYRVDGRKPVHVNVRIISATSVDLKKHISEGLFRQDLYYRLNVVSLEVPPLASRREDVKSLVDLFSKKISQKIGIPPKKFSKEALASLEAYNWPGNIRQLQNVVEWVMIMHPEETEVKPHQLPGEVQLSKQKEVEEVMDANLLLGLQLKEAREEFEKTYIALHVKRFNGNISKTAAAIGMERTALHRKIKLLTVPAEQLKSPLEVG